MKNIPSANDEATSLRQVNKQETRRELLRAGLELFTGKGYVNTRAAEIAERAGVAVGTLYLHFGDKEGLLCAILEEQADGLHAHVMQVYIHPPEDAYALARAHVEAIVNYIEQDPGIARLLLNYILTNAIIRSDLLDKIVAQVAQGLREGAVQGTYRADIDYDLAARAEVNMNLGVLSWWSEHRDQIPREQVIETLAKFRYSGLHVSK